MTSICHSEAYENEDIRLENFNSLYSSELTDHDKRLTYQILILVSYYFDTYV